MGMFSGLSPEATVALGVLVGLLSTCVQSVGLTLQRKSHMLEDEKAEYEPRRPAYRRRRWQVGMLLFLVANIVGSTIQITTLPLPLLSTLQASGLVFNSILASLLLKEPWTWRTAWGTILVAGGAVLISSFSALPEPSHNLRQLIELLGKRDFLIWFILSLVLVVAMLAMDFTMRKFVPASRRDSPRVHLVRGMSYGAISGILSAHALLLAKSAVELIVRSIADKKNQFSSYQSWLLLLAFLVLALSQLYYLHLGLRLISTSVLYPFVFCIYNIVAILDGLIYFQQTSKLPALHAGLIAIGTVILLAGVLALSWRLQDGEDEDEEHKHMAQHEIPQTVLTPGLGFVGDPDSDENSEFAIADEDVAGDVEEGERRPLLSIKRQDTTRSTKTTGGRKRKRAATLKEVIDIWEEFGDNEEPYSAFEASPTAESRRPVSAGHQRQTRRRRDSAGRSLEAGDADAEDVAADTNLQRSSTMPTPPKGSRRSTHSGSGALFRDLLKADWWRTRRKSAQERNGSDEREEER
jgi:magnesium transporter